VPTRSHALLQVGFDKSITTLKNPLTAMKTDIMVSARLFSLSLSGEHHEHLLQTINDSLNAQRTAIEEKLREQEAIRQRRQVIQSIIDVQKSVQKLNELDDAINLSK
jgi:hypothetical protein